MEALALTISQFRFRQLDLSQVSEGFDHGSDDIVPVKVGQP
jgi:hypothetical protein